MTIERPHHRTIILLTAYTRQCKMFETLASILILLSPSSIQSRQWLFIRHNSKCASLRSPSKLASQEDIFRASSHVPFPRMCTETSSSSPFPLLANMSGHHAQITGKVIGAACFSRHLLGRIAWWAKRTFAWETRSKLNSGENF